MIEIRKIRANEFDLIKALRIRALTDAPDAFGGTLGDATNKPIDQYESDTIRWAESENSTIFIAFESNEAIGKAGAFFEAESSRAFLCSMWVDPNYRYRGIGKNIVTTVVSWLNRRGASSVYAWVVDNNHSAIKFYKSLGFIATPEKEKLTSNPDEVETLYVLNLKANHPFQRTER